MRARYLISENGRIAGVKTFAKNKTVYALASSNHWSCTENSANNAWNVNFNNGNTNNNNKYNTNLVVRAVAALTDEDAMLWIDAYDNCCRNKRTSAQCALYRLNYEEDLLMLAAEVNMRVYTQRPSEAFCVKYPKVREIFAAHFRDRIAQHWITLQVEPLFEAMFVEVGDASYNCRKGYGTLAAVKKQESNIRKVSEGWTREAWVGCGDIQAFFMSIDTRLMWHMYESFIRERYRGDNTDTLLWLSKMTIMHEPQKNCVRKGDVRLWDILPKHKSLFGSDKYKGMPIGNITTQLLANFFMSGFDRWAVEEVSKFGGTYLRFVDDTRVVACDKEKIMEFYRRADTRLREHLRLTLHPDKHYMQPVRHGDAFVGAVIKPHRTYISNRTRGRMKWRFTQMELLCNKPDVENRRDILERCTQSMNSYLGLLIHYHTYAIRVKALTELTAFWRYCSVIGKYNHIKLKRYE